MRSLGNIRLKYVAIFLKKEQLKFFVKWSKIDFDWLMWKNMSELSDKIEKLGPAHAILRG